MVVMTQYKWKIIQNVFILAFEKYVNVFLNTRFIFLIGTSRHNILKRNLYYLNS